MKSFKNIIYEKLWATDLIVTQIELPGFKLDFEKSSLSKDNQQIRLRIEDILNVPAIKNLQEKIIELCSNLIDNDQLNINSLSIETGVILDNQSIINLSFYREYEYFMILFIDNSFYENDSHKFGQITLMDPRSGCSNVSTPTLIFGRPLSFPPIIGLGVIFPTFLDLFISPIHERKTWTCLYSGIKR